MWVECTSCMLCHVACPVGSMECSPGVCCLLWGLKAVLDLLGPYCVYRM